MSREAVVLDTHKQATKNSIKLMLVLAAMFELRCCGVVVGTI